MKSLLIALVFAMPAVAQSINPFMYGQRYCYLRQLGVDAPSARKAAVEYSYDHYRNSATMKNDTAAAARYVITNCPDS
jgi:hypothetical protein